MTHNKREILMWLMVSFLMIFVILVWKSNLGFSQVGSVDDADKSITEIFDSVKSELDHFQAEFDELAKDSTVKMNEVVDLVASSSPLEINIAQATSSDDNVELPEKMIQKLEVEQSTTTNSTSSDISIK